MVRRALCPCGGLVPRSGTGSQSGLCLQCFQARRRRQWVGANLHYRVNHGYTDGSPYGNRAVINPIGMVVVASKSAGFKAHRAKNPRYR